MVLGGKDTNYWGLVDKSGKQILEDVNKGFLISEEIILTRKQEIEITKLIQSAPCNYSLYQKALISKKSGADILNEVKFGNDSLEDIIFNYKQHKEMKILINKNPASYSERQKYFIRKKTGVRILREVGLGIRSPININLTDKQLREIRQLIRNNPDEFNDNQKSLIK